MNLYIRAILLEVIHYIKTMKKSTSLNRSPRLMISMLVFSMMLLVAGSVLPIVQSIVTADTYDDQVAQIRSQNQSAQSTLAGLLGEAATYQEAIDRLQAQVNALQGRINDNVAEQTRLEAEITAAQAEIDHQRAILSEDVKAMYVDGTPSTFEVFASSKNLSEFVDKQEYRSRVQNKLQDTLKKIAALQKQLQEQKAKVEQLLKELQTERDQVATMQSQQQSLLNYNESQQSDINAQLSANNKRISQLRAAQAAAYAQYTGSGGTSPVGSSIKYRNMTGPSSCGGGYRYCGYGLDQWVADPWGLGLARECVHYVADRVDQLGKRVPTFPGGGGSAYQWIPFATSSGAGHVVSDPQAGDVVYMPIGPVGHVAVVEWNNGDGSVHVSQFNWYSGRYNEMDLILTSNLQFLRFNDK